MGLEDTGSELRGLDCHPVPATVLGKALGPPGPVFLLKHGFGSAWLSFGLCVGSTQEVAEEESGLGRCTAAPFIQSRLCCALQVGFDPHPPMRATGLPSSLASIPGGKP